MEAKTLRQRARSNLAGNWGISVGAALIAALLGGLHTSSGYSFEFDLSTEAAYELPPELISIFLTLTSVASLLSFAAFIIGGVVQLGYARFLLKQHDGQELTIKDLFSQFDRFGTGFAQAFLRGLYIILWSLLLIIPGIVKSLSYSMTPFLLADHPEMTARQAIDASKEMMDDHKMDLFILELTFIGWTLLSALTLGIGILFLNPYMNAAYAAFYRQLKAEQEIPLIE